MTTLVSGHGLKHLYSAALTIILPEIKVGLELSNAATGAVITSRDLCSGLVNLPAGFVADRYSSRWSLILVISLLLVGMGFFLSGTFINYWLILVAIALTGVGTSMWHPAAIAALSRRFPQTRGFALSLHGAGGNVGEVIGPLIAGGVLLILAWTHLLQVSLIPIVVASAIIWAALRGMRGQEGVSSVAEYLSAAVGLFRSRTLMSVVLLSGTRSISHHTIAVFLPIYLREDLEYSPLVVGIYIALLHVVGIAATPAMGYLSDRFGRKAVLTPGMVFFSLLCVALAFATPGPLLILTILVMGSVIFTFHAVFVATAMDIAKEEIHATTVALVYSSSSVIGALGPVLGGVLADVYSIKATFFFAAGVAAVTALLITTIRLPKVNPVSATVASHD